MKKVNEWITIIVLLILGVILTGCGVKEPTTQSGVNKEYVMTATARESSTITLNVNLDAVTSAETESGDAGVAQSWETWFTAAWNAANAQGAKESDAFMEGLENWWEKKDDHSVTPAPTPVPPAPIPTPIPDPPPPIPDPDPDDVIIDDELTFGTYKCEDLAFTYHDTSETTGIKQLVCTFTDYVECSDIPEEAFTMVWKDANGEFEYLEVSDRCTIAMASKEDGYGKFRPAHDKEPFKPVAYAPREFDAVEVDLVKKQ